MTSAGEYLSVFLNVKVNVMSLRSKILILLAGFSA